MFQTDYYEIYSKKIKGSVKIVMLADLHNHLFGIGNKELLDAIRAEAPDFVCLAGDMLIGSFQSPHDVAQDLVLELAKEYPVFYGLGNHEHRIRGAGSCYGKKYTDYMDPIKAAGVTVLENRKAKLEIGRNQFQIYGYELPMKYFEKFNRYKFEASQVEKVLGSCKEESGYQILLAHNPVYFPQYAKWGADLTLSGHLHGGIIRLPLVGGIITPQARILPKYCAGKYEWKDHVMVVSRGLGTHTIPFRINNPPELSVIYLKEG